MLSVFSLKGREGIWSAFLRGQTFVGMFKRHGLGLIRSSSEIEELAASVPDCGGAPYWDQYARGIVTWLMGAGSVTYSGNPKSVETNVIGAGSIRHLPSRNHCTTAPPINTLPSKAYSIRPHEAAGAVGVVCQARTEAILAEQGGLLVAGPLQLIAEVGGALTTLERLASWWTR